MAILKQTVVADPGDILDSRLLHHFRTHNRTTATLFKAEIIYGWDFYCRLQGGS